MTAHFWDRYAATGYDALHVLLPYAELQQTLLAVLAPTSAMRLLVAGCGTGWFEYLCMQHTPEISIEAMDFSGEMLKRARAKCAHFPQVSHRQGDLCATLPFADASFDAAVMCNVLYSLPTSDSTLRELARVLRPGGRLVLTDPFPWLNADTVRAAHLAGLRRLHGWRKLTELARTASAALALLRVWRTSQAIETERKTHYHFRTEDEAVALLQAHGFTVMQRATAYAGQNWLLSCQR